MLSLRSRDDIAAAASSEVDDDDDDDDDDAASDAIVDDAAIGVDATERRKRANVSNSASCGISDDDAKLIFCGFCVLVFQNKRVGVRQNTGCRGDSKVHAHTH